MRNGHGFPGLVSEMSVCCRDVPGSMVPSPHPNSSAHYLFDFRHIPDKSLIIDEIQ